MLPCVRNLLVAGIVSAGAVLAAEPAAAQWGYYGPAYGGTSFSFGFSSGPAYTAYRPTYSYVAPPVYYGYTAYSAPVYQSYYPVYSAPVTYGAPRGRVSYDLYTPFGRSEVNYRYRRNGTVRVDFDR